MKCPYQTRVIHKPEYTEGYVRNFAEDINTIRPKIVIPDKDERRGN